ncbi:MAG: ParB N-terminal domain-containing protein [Chloroflexota bacterium]|nr:ParB N-terminal domain-containing protein [Chloroflexota bacterium]
MTAPELLGRGITRLPIDAIKVENRRREEFGDLAGLAESISRLGLLHPIVVDDDGRLIAGERRLRACRELGFLEIEARRWGSLSDAERDEIELEENVRRKDLTPYERSKATVRLAEKAAEVDRARFRSESERNPAGRPEKAGSLRRVAERIGTPAPTIHLAKQHVQAVDHYPELAPMPQRDAVKIASKLDAMPEPERVEKRAAVMRQEPAVLAELTDRPPLPGVSPPRLRRHAADD